MTSIFLWAHCVFFFFIHFPFDAVSARWFCMLVYVTETMPLSGLLFALLVEFSCSIYFYQNGIVMWVVYGSNYDEIYISENLEQARARSLFTQLLICCLNGFVAGVTHRRNLNFDLVWFRKNAFKLKLMWHTNVESICKSSRTEKNARDRPPHNANAC